MSTSSHDDVPCPIDLRNPATAAEWAEAADRKRPWRHEVRGKIAELVSDAARVLELGSGPGQLAEAILAANRVEVYTLFDFSPPFLAMARARLAAYPVAHYVLGDFTRAEWPLLVGGPYDAIVTMQAVHETRHKRHAATLYTRALAVLRPGGLLVVCDHDPGDPSARLTSNLYATEAEQHAALAAAGFEQVTTAARVQGLYVCAGRRSIAYAV